VIGRERQLITAAGGGAVDDGDVALARIFRGVLEAVAGLIGEFAKIDLVRVRRAREHADIGAGAEHAVLARADHDDLHLRILEAQPLHGIRQFDIDAEIIGIEFELVALEQAAILVDIHGQGRGISLDRELPVPVARRIGLEIDVFRSPGEHAIFTGHEPPLRFLSVNSHAL
jgi:hypothetical protein